MSSSLNNARERMEKALETVRREFSGVRTGKASPALLDSVRVEAYGSMLPVNQVGQVSAPEPRMLTVVPYDKSLIKAVERALRESDLGLNPSNDGAMIRIPLPPLTEERRREYVKLLHRYAEEGRVAVRQARQHANDDIKKRQKDGELTEDEMRRSQDQVQKLTDEYVHKVDDLLKKKEAEVLEV
ncbi:MAG TPA: ribosome recycling factor [Longimicrobiaceae bacterium]|jgi:ribosome recycling factor